MSTSAWETCFEIRLVFNNRSLKNSHSGWKKNYSHCSSRCLDPLLKPVVTFIRWHWVSITQSQKVNSLAISFSYEVNQTNFGSMIMWTATTVDSRKCMWNLPKIFRTDFPSASRKMSKVTTRGLCIIIIWCKNPRTDIIPWVGSSAELIYD